MGECLKTGSSVQRCHKYSLNNWDLIKDQMISTIEDV